MKLNKLILTALLLSTCANPAPAETPCDYESKVNTEYTKKIEKVLEFDKKVYPYVEDTRKCVINMSVIIDGVTHQTRGDFVFGPDITENSACKNAENRAKETVIRKVSPEILSAKTDMSCKSTVVEKIVEKKIEPKVEPINETIVIQPIGSIVSSEVISIVQMQPPISTSDFRNMILGNNRTVTINATQQKGLITGIALELMRWIN